MDALQSIPAWVQQLIAGAVLAIISAGAGYLYKRKTLPSDIHKTEADANLAEAQAADLRFRTRKDVTEAFDEMAADLGEAVHEKIRLRGEILRLQEQVRLLEHEAEQYKAERTLKRLGTDSGEFAGGA
jgi:hypothetical protein